MSEKTNAQACRITEQNRDKVVEAYIDRIVRDMSVDMLLEYVRGAIEADLKGYSNEQLETEITEQYDDLLPEVIDGQED